MLTQLGTYCQQFDGTLRPLLGDIASALIAIAAMQPPPRRFIAGSDSIAIAEQRIADLQAQVDALRELSTALAI